MAIKNFQHAELHLVFSVKLEGPPLLARKKFSVIEDALKQLENAILNLVFKKNTVTLLILEAEYY